MEVVRVLLTRINCGLDPTLRDAQGKTAIDRMKEEKDVDNKERESWLLVRFWLLQSASLFAQYSVLVKRLIRACLQQRRITNTLPSSTTNALHPSGSSSALAALLAPTPTSVSNNSGLLLTVASGIVPSTTPPVPVIPSPQSSQSGGSGSASSPFVAAALMPREVVEIVLSYFA